jgi:hypothetical protein
MPDTPQKAPRWVFVSENKKWVLKMIDEIGSITETEDGYFLVHVLGFEDHLSPSYEYAVHYLKTRIAESLREKAGDLNELADKLLALSDDRF